MSTQKNFVTLFNSSYLSRGITLYHSLLQNCADFHLYVIAFDEFTFKFLSSENYPRLTVVSLHEFEDEELKAVKSQRSATEYCWTCTPSTVYYCLRRYNLDHCVYIDADMYFYSDPEPLYTEWGERSVLITRHRFSKLYEEAAWNGIYCVQFVGFKNDEQGLNALKWWRKACIEWCYNRLEDGKFGDQKYLDDWPQRFGSVCDLEYLGGGVAPWNVQQYEFTRHGDQWKGRELSSGKEFDLIFFHFHALRFYTNHTVALSAGYDLSNKGVQAIYSGYIRQLLKTGRQLEKKIPQVNFHGIHTASPFLPATGTEKLKDQLRKLLGRPSQISADRENLYDLAKFEKE